MRRNGSKSTLACYTKVFYAACLLLAVSACGDLEISRNIVQESDSIDTKEETREEIKEEVREEIKKLACEESGKFEGKPCD